MGIMKRSVSRSIIISSCLLLFSAAPGSVACETGSLTITNLPDSTGAGYEVFGLNSSGQLTGFFYIVGDHPGHSFVYTDGNLSDLGTLGGSTSEGHAINASGQIVGKANLPGDSQAHAFFSDGQTLTDLGTLGGPRAPPPPSMIRASSSVAQTCPVA